MRTTTHVHPVIAGPIDGQFLALRQFSRPLCLEALTGILPCRNQGITRHDFTAQRLVGADDRAHVFFYRGQIIHCERPACGRCHDVIIKTVIGRWAKSDLRAGKQRLHRLCQYMREIVPGELQRVRLVAAGHQRQLGIGLNRAHDIAQFAIDARRNRCLG